MPEPERTDALATARCYADRGWRVIALHRVGGTERMCSCGRGANCPSSGKHPLAKAWQNEPRLSDADLERLFGGPRPYNVGIATGPDSGIFVLDIDKDAGGFASLRALGEQHGKAWASGYRVQTGSGGIHLYFRYPADIVLGNRAGSVFGPGIDVRGVGGQVVAPPSVSAKGAYVVAHEADVPEAPGWMIDALRPKERKKAPAPRSGNETAPPTADWVASPNADDPESSRLQAYVDGAIEHELGRLREMTSLRAPSMSGYSGPSWDSTTFEVACNLFQIAEADWNDLSHERVEDLVLEHAPEPDHEGWTLERVHEKIESARRRVEGDPLPVPPKPFDLIAALEGVSAPSAPSAPSRTEPSASAGEDLLAAAEADAPVERPRVRVQTLAGIPFHEGKLSPDLVATQLAERLKGEYRKGLEHDVLESPVTDDIEQLVHLPREGAHGPLDAFEDWLSAALVTGTPDLFWAALGVILRGVDCDAPLICLVGAEELLSALSGRLRPPVGAEPEVLLFGPRVATTAADEGLVLEFRDIPTPDITPILDSIIDRALQHAGIDEDQALAMDEFDDQHYADFRIAQRARRALGLTRGVRDHG